jgi:hypothetical protein
MNGGTGSVTEITDSASNILLTTGGGTGGIYGGAGGSAGGGGEAAPVARIKLPAVAARDPRQQHRTWLSAHLVARLRQVRFNSQAVPPRVARVAGDDRLLPWPRREWLSGICPDHVLGWLAHSWFSAVSIGVKDRPLRVTHDHSNSFASNRSDFSEASLRFFVGGGLLLFSRSSQNGSARQTDPQDQLLKRRV